MDTERWAWRAAVYAPELEPGSQRDVGHPHGRWDDQIKSFLASRDILKPWHDIARDSVFWQSLEDDFVADCNESTGTI